jgi:NifQ.
MTADEIYRWLMGEGAASFDRHVVASILALSAAEADEIGRPLNEMAGYDGLPPALAALFPHAASRISGGGDLRREEDEECLLQLLIASMTAGTALEKVLAGLIARRAQRPHHLWQDLGLRSRRELSDLMATHFAPLARRNKSDMKWKKFFFRTICSGAEYVLCTAPSCSECSDFDNCFGEENGASFLAHLRRDAEQAGSA